MRSAFPAQVLRCRISALARHMNARRPVGWLRALAVGGAASAIVFAAPAYAEPNNGQWDPSLPSVLSAGAPGDPVAIANASLQATALATQTTMDMGRKFLGLHGYRKSGDEPERQPEW